MQEIDINYHQKHSCTEIPRKIIRKFGFQSLILLWKFCLLPLPSVRSANEDENMQGQQSNPMCEPPLLPLAAITWQAPSHHHSRAPSGASRRSKGDTVVGMRIKFIQERSQTRKGYLLIPSTKTLKYIYKKGNIWKTLLNNLGFFLRCNCYFQNFIKHKRVLKL